MARGRLFGLDVVLIYIAFRQSYRSGLMHETIQLSATELTIRRVSPYGRINTWIFQPYWLRMRIDDPPEHSSPLTLSSPLIKWLFPALTPR